MKFIGDAVSLLYLSLFLLAALRYAALLLPREDGLTRTAAGVSLALFAQMWLPALFSFALGFTLASQLLGLALFLLPLPFLRKKHGPAAKVGRRTFRLHLFCVLPALLLCAALLCTHVLRPQDGAYHTGQSCFGDMSMHLAFITSLARTGAFPPEYSIQAGVKMGYPFLCDSVSSTYLLLGAHLQ